jgi:hypothetical protein
MLAVCLRSWNMDAGSILQGRRRRSVVQKFHMNVAQESLISGCSVNWRPGLLAPSKQNKMCCRGWAWLGLGQTCGLGILSQSNCMHKEPLLLSVWSCSTSSASDLAQPITAGEPRSCARSHAAWFEQFSFQWQRFPLYMFGLCRLAMHWDVDLLLSHAVHDVRLRIHYITHL